MKNLPGRQEKRPPPRFAGRLSGEIVSGTYGMLDINERLSAVPSRDDKLIASTDRARVD